MALRRFIAGRTPVTGNNEQAALVGVGKRQRSEPKKPSTTRNGGKKPNYGKLVAGCFGPSTGGSDLM